MKTGLLKCFKPILEGFNVWKINSQRNITVFEDYVIKKGLFQVVTFNIC